MGWFDELDADSTNTDTTADDKATEPVGNAQPAPAEADTAEKDTEKTAVIPAVPEPQRSASSQTPSVQEDEPVDDKKDTPRRGVSKTALATAAAVGLLVTVGLGAVWFMSGSDATDSEVEAEPAATESEQASSQPASSTTSTSEKPQATGNVGPGCQDDSTLEQDSPAAAVVDFQKAYFAQDADKLREGLASDSPLNNTDWDDVLQDFHGDKDSWCVSVKSVDGKTVEAVTTGKDGDEPFTWDQKITTTEKDGGYVVKSVENRS